MSNIDITPIDQNPPMNLIKEASLTVSSPHLERVRQIHAFMIFIPPIVLTALAIYLGVERGVSSTAIWLLVGFFLANFIGVTVGYHRHFTHRSFKAWSIVRFALGVCGSMACEGPVNYWVSNHRRHHMFTDKDRDIHSPHIHAGRRLGFWAGLWHSHIAWTFRHEVSNTAIAAPGLLRDPVAKAVSSTYYVWVAAGFVLPALIGGYVSGTWYGAVEGFLWGGAVRLFLTYQLVHTITSLAHIFGYQDFNNGDQSRNNIWLAIPTFGEAWHNNHHSFPGSATFGHKWWQVDLGAYFIFLLKLLGLAWDVKTVAADAMNRKMQAG
jgi:stearoyl-CoA desaturase (delta-9 desaturase)